MPFKPGKSARHEVTTSTKASTTTGALADLGNLADDSYYLDDFDDDDQLEADFNRSETAKRMANSALYLNYLLSNEKKKQKELLQQQQQQQQEPVEDEELHIDNYVNLVINLEGDLDANNYQQMSGFSNKQLITEEQFNQAFILNVCV